MHTFTGVTLRTAGPQSFYAYDPAAGVYGQQDFTVLPGAATNFVVSGYPAGAAAGTLNSFTVTAMDAWGNVATGYTGTVHFSSDDTGPMRALPMDYVFNAGDAGTHTFLAAFDAGTWYLRATDTMTSSITGEQDGIVVV
jgi:hypothetical protein